MPLRKNNEEMPKYLSLLYLAGENIEVFLLEFFEIDFFSLLVNWINFSSEYPLCSRPWSGLQDQVN